jgi:hypothetical protein
MIEPDIKILTVKMRGIRGCAKTELLLAIARFVRQFGMVPSLKPDCHDMSIVSTKRQRLALYDFNHRPGAPVAEWPAPNARSLLADGDVA